MSGGLVVFILGSMKTKYRISKKNTGALGSLTRTSIPLHSKIKHSYSLMLNMSPDIKRHLSGMFHIMLGRFMVLP